MEVKGQRSRSPLRSEPSPHSPPPTLHLPLQHAEDERNRTSWIQGRRPVWAMRQSDLSLTSKNFYDLGAKGDLTDGLWITDGETEVLNVESEQKGPQLFPVELEGSPASCGTPIWCSFGPMLFRK